MKILFYVSNEIAEDNILYGLLAIGVDATQSKLSVGLNLLNSEQIEMIVKESRNYDAVITRDFSVNVAEGCHISGIPYISWCYDSPVMALYTDQALYKTNYIFVFDKSHLKRLENIGLKNVYYQPLAANMVKAELASLDETNINNKACEVSFVGQLYENSFYPFFKKNAPVEIMDECEKVLERHICRWGEKGALFNEISDEAVDILSSKLDRNDGMGLSIDNRFLVEMTVLVYELSSRDRFKALDYIGSRFDTVIHTRNPEKVADRITATILPPLDQLSNTLFETYLASKINLNLTMRSIETGVPQRIYDIMSIGGCVFSNYQKEAAELFEPDKEIVLFKSMDEFVDKARYYLNHERNRLEICYNGYLRVKECYNYPIALKNILSKL